MDIKDLKVGDVIYIREDLVDWEIYDALIYYPKMRTGMVKVKHVLTDYFKVQDEVDYLYNTKMVDWDKTKELKNLSWFKEITQFGESGNETTKAITYDGREIIVKNNNEENDVEKAVMLLMLKQRGVTYTDVKREVEKVKVKWRPAIGEQFYYISTTPTIKARALTYFTEGALKEMTDAGNYFRTKEDAEEKIEKIKEILKGEE